MTKVTEGITGQKQRVMHNELVHAYLRGTGTKLVWIGGRLEHYECGCTVCCGVEARFARGPLPCSAHWAAIHRLIGTPHMGRQGDYL